MIRTLKDFNRERTVIFKIISADSLIRLKKYDGNHTGLGPGLDGNGHPVTGLTEDWEETGPKGGKVHHKGTRRVMEVFLDLAEGTLKNTSVYWVSYNVRIGAEDEKLNLRDDYDLLKFLFLSAQSIVANSLKEIENNSKAEFVLYSEEMEAAAKVETRTFLKRAYVLSDQLDLETKINLCTVFGHKVDATEINTIENKIMEELESDPEGFLNIAEDDRLIYHSIISRALDAGILELKDGGVVHGDIPLGHDKASSAIMVSKDKKLEAILKAKLSGDMDLIRKALIAEEPEVK